eukprot:TRINITY_DN68032_c0_g1_i1.p1 TRINITY_DN68032_c0_g1~~TRINITY_DN68032_c0_g1_i1.p1  ORF type:complete len:214 (+),score=31.46 TRINITY_DN68032_c0_g1_i1:38-679(+)
MISCGLFLAGLFALVAALFFIPSSSNLSEDITVINHSYILDKHLTKYQDVIGKDYEGYKGHLYRVLSYTMHYLGGDNKYRNIIEVALVYHDLGLWTDHTMAYLEPSTALAQKEMAGEYSAEELQLLDNLIMYHHKITPWHGPHEDVVNAFRKADWIDATMGVVAHGMPKAAIAKVTNAIAEAGFHQTLLDFGPKLYGWNIYKIMSNGIKIMRW